MTRSEKNMHRKLGNFLFKGNIQQNFHTSFVPYQQLVGPWPGLWLRFTIGLKFEDMSTISIDSP